MKIKSDIDKQLYGVIRQVVTDTCRANQIVTVLTVFEHTQDHSGAAPVHAQK